MTLHEYFWGLTRAEQKSFADRAKTSHTYLLRQIIPKKIKRPRKGATIAMLFALADASEGHVSRLDAFNHFDQEDELNAA